MSALYTATIGLEIHAELKTRTKMFCDSKNDSEETKPNHNVCPICLAHPGTLPVINKEAVRHVLRVGTALGGELADYTEFDRKSYFYPDIPKGYQISQYEHPLVKGGTLNGVAITRVHLEEDTARSTHQGAVSLVDFNRAGVPLMELVTEPVIHDAQSASAFARELQALLRALGASDAHLEKGEMRIEANISVSNSQELGTKVEVKNLNSFRSVERAIAYEIARHTKALESGETLIQETRGWDETKEVTFHQRTKEGSADYRYFPEPDLPKLILSELPEFSRKTLEESLPELPAERRARYIHLGLKEEDAQYLAYTNPRSIFFDAVVTLLELDMSLVPLAANYTTSDIAGFFAKKGEEAFEALEPEHFAELIKMIARNELSSRGAKDVLVDMLEKGGSPKVIADVKGLIQVSDPETLRISVQEVIRANETVAKEYQSGKESALQFLVGQAMKTSKGAGNPAVIATLLKEELGKSK